MDKENLANGDEAPTDDSDGPSETLSAATVLKARVRRTVDDFQRGIDREKNFRFLFDAYYDSTRYFLAKRVSSPDDCLDLTQETFLRVYKGLEGYRGEAQFGTWVFRIAFNTYLKWLRRVRIDGENSAAKRGTDALESAWEDDEIIAIAAEETPLEQVLRTERRKVLRSAITELPEQMRRCTELRIYHDLSYREIATVMRRSIETIKVHLFQARRKLRDSFGDVDL